jgi:hypothetical protein
VSGDSGLLKEWLKEGLPLAWKASGSADHVDLAARQVRLICVPGGTIQGRCETQLGGAYASI